MKTIAIYLRLSNEDINEGESNSISNQRDLTVLKKWMKFIA